MKEDHYRKQEHHEVEAQHCAELEAEHHAEMEAEHRAMEAEHRAEMEAEYHAEEAQHCAELEAEHHAEMEAEHRAMEAEHRAEMEAEYHAEEAQHRAELEAEHHAEMEAEYRAMEAEHRAEMEEEYDRGQEERWYKKKSYSEFYSSFILAISELRIILDNDTSGSDILYKMVYVHSVTVMETFLSDTIKSLLISNEKYIANSIKNLDELKNNNYKLSTIINKKGGVNAIVFDEISSYMYHNIPKVKNIYRAVLGIVISHDIKNVSKITSIRHDVVHRNGKKLDGNLIKIDKP